MQNINFISTRSSGHVASFEEIITAGLAPNGGLYVPQSIPQFSKSELLKMTHCGYEEIVFSVLKKFSGNSIPDTDLQNIIFKSYSTFSHSAIAPIYQLAENEFVCDLFYGPTFAFKDFALQMLGNLIGYFLKKSGQNAIILGATSGDTGSAAIYGCMDIENANVVILHPNGKTSDFQRKQMTTTGNSKVHNIAINGNFDDCQSIVKHIFSTKDSNFPNTDIISVNSINLVRIIAQTAYYFYCVTKLGGVESEDVSFSVPTGNFGNIYSGYLAKKMGLPIKKLICATNKNNILHRFFESLDYSKNQVSATISPSMDIGIASNFERLIFDLCGQNPDETSKIMQDLASSNKIDALKLKQNHNFSEILSIFDSYYLTDEQTNHAIVEFYGNTGTVFDPHTAIALKSAQLKRPMFSRVVSLATAHPLKFSESISNLDLHDHVHYNANMLDAMFKIHNGIESFEVLENDQKTVIDHIRSVVS